MNSTAKPTLDINKVLLSDLLFLVQIAGALTLCGSQFFRLLDTTNGQLLSMFLSIEAYLVLHFLLALAAHQAHPSRATRQTVATYVMWMFLIGSNIVAIVINGSYAWSANDNRVLVMSACSITALLAIARWFGKALNDPMVKGIMAMILKALPQFVMAFEVAYKGGAGVPAAAIIAGNITILVRIGQIAITIREAGWDRNRTWLFASETINELSWACVTLVWLFTL